MRIDLYLLEKGLVKTRSQATDLLKRGLVFHKDIQVMKTGYDIDIDDNQVYIKEPLIYVSRAGVKLKDALDYFSVSLKDQTIIDIGASTGGFTDCALKEGAREVFAYDVGKNQIDASLKNNPLVHSFEQTNILSVAYHQVDVVLIDVSFTSIKPILEHIKTHQGIVLALIKPQFEAGPISMKQGVLKDKKIIKHILVDIAKHANIYGFDILGIKKSDLKGKQGNQEYIFYLKQSKQPSYSIKRIGEIL